MLSTADESQNKTVLWLVRRMMSQLQQSWARVGGAPDAKPLSRPASPSGLPPGRALTVPPLTMSTKVAVMKKLTKL